MGGPEKRWDSNTERDLCIAVFMATQTGRVSYNWAKTHEIMQSMGHTFTKDAISQHFTKKIFKDCKDRHGDIIGSGPATPNKAPGTPVKRKAGSAKKLAETKRHDDADADEGCDDDDVGGELAATPSKKVKLEKPQPATLSKKQKKTQRGPSENADFDEEKFKTWLKRED